MIAKDGKSALTYISKRKELEEKPAEKLLSGLFEEAIIKSWQKKNSEDIKVVKEELQCQLTEMLNEFSWEVVQDLVEKRKGRLELIRTNIILGINSCLWLLSYQFHHHHRSV